MKQRGTINNYPIMEVSEEDCLQIVSGSSKLRIKLEDFRGGIYLPRESLDVLMDCLKQHMGMSVKVTKSEF